MVSRLVHDLERPLSRIRLENYRPTNGSDLEMIVTYFHNLELSEALYASLQAFEVALRNSVHLTLATHFGTPFWFDTPGLFPPPPPPASVPWQGAALRAAREKLSKEAKPHEPDRIVAEMHFGFWHSLFNRPFERELWRPNQAALLVQAFPHISRKNSNRQFVWNRIDRIRILRNRVMHYEPVWHRPRLLEDHAAILEALSWISPVMHRTIAMCDRFPEVLTTGRASMELKVLAELQRRDGEL